MRKVYILQEDESDGELAEALLAQGFEPNEEAFANSECPKCGEATVLIYTERGRSWVLTCGTEDLADEAVEADGWFMACGSPECTWEEAVERVFALEPGAEIFDLSFSSVYLDEEVGLTSGNAQWFTRLESFFEGLMVEAPTRKLRCYLDEVRSGRKWVLESVRDWLDRVPEGRRVQISTGEESFQGKFVTHTTEGCLILAEPAGELIAFPIECIEGTGPHAFPPEPPPDQRPQPPTSRRFLAVSQRERVVAQGHVLELRYIDRFGMFHVASRDAKAAEALGLQPVSLNAWWGRLRPCQIEDHYQVERKVRVRGHWLHMVGKYTDGGLRVRTWDPRVAAELGFESKHSSRGEAIASLYGWDGEVPPDLVEEEGEVRQDLF